MEWINSVLKTKIIKQIESYYDDNITLEQCKIDSCLLLNNDQCKTNIQFFENMKKHFTRRIYLRIRDSEIKYYINTTILDEAPELYQYLLETVPEILSKGGNTSKNWRRKRKSAKQKKRSRGSTKRKNATKRRTSR